MIRDEMGSAMERSIIRPVEVVGPYSPARRVGNFLFVSGQIAINQETGSLRDENIEVETRQVLDNLTGILRSAGFDSSHASYGGYLQEGCYPSRVTVEVSEIPRRANVEISLIAYK